MMTRYSKFTRIQSIILIVTSIFIAFCFCNIMRKYPYNFTLSNTCKELNDGFLYEAVSERVRQGENYYDAAAYELRIRGYSTESIFNWRTPCYSWLFGKLPSSVWGQGLLTLCVILAGAATWVVKIGMTGWKMKLWMYTCVVVSYGWILCPQVAYFTEIWSGLLIFMSVCANARAKWRIGLFLAICAVAIRELALLYILITSFTLIINKKFKISIYYILVALMFLCYYYFWHYRSVVRRTGRPVSFNGIQWIALGGAPFALSACRMNFVVAILPPWCGGVFTTLSLLGLFGSNEKHSKLILYVCLSYLILFNFLGKSFNYYWGWMIVPLLSLGFSWSIPSLTDLFKTACKK